VTRAFARRARQIAEAEGLDGEPMGDYLKLARACKNNLREMLQRVEIGQIA
jgi:hypothetical protein